MSRTPITWGAAGSGGSPLVGHSWDHPAGVADMAGSMWPLAADRSAATSWSMGFNW
jgi:hypothetical protein